MLGYAGAGAAGAAVGVGAYAGAEHLGGDGPARSTGMHQPEDYGDTTTPESTRAAIQAAINAASNSGGGTVYLPSRYTVGPNPTEPSLALYTRSNVALVGASWGSSQVMLAAGSNCHLLAGAGDLDDKRSEVPTDFVSIRELTLHGNRAQQKGTRDHHGLFAVRHPHLRLSGVRITECDGNGYHSTGGSTLGIGGTQTVRPLWLADVLCDNNSGWGFYSSATNREFHGTGLHAEANGTKGSNEFGGAFLDHSEDLIAGFTARLNHGDGFYIHNVQACHYVDLHAVANDGYGIYVEAMVQSEGRGWQALANCQNFAEAPYRKQATATAEVYFSANSGSYGVSRASRVDGIHAPGDKSFAGPADDNRFADWGLFVENGVDTGSLQLTNYVPGDGGKKGALRRPT